MSAYGIWRCADDREVLFNRDYQPIWQRRPGEPATPADPKEWVREIVEQRWFHDSHVEKRHRQKAHATCAAALAAFQAGEPVSRFVWEARRAE